MPRETAPALKDWFDEARFRSVASLLAGLHPRFDRRRFLRLGLEGLDELSLMQRLRRMTEATRSALPLGYLDSLDVLHRLAPQLGHAFVAVYPPDFVGLYGRGHFDESMAALRFLTPYGSSEFAVREFLRDDLPRALSTMREWAEDPDEHVRRLASEGCRPRLPWSFRLAGLIEDPRPALSILEALRSDPSLYVRKSVANHLNDISRDHPEIVLDTLRRWDLDDPRSAWIARRGLRTLVKQGQRAALALLGAGEAARVRIDAFRVEPARIRLGEELGLALELVSTSPKPQRLVVDYLVHYARPSGLASEKVFKWKELELGPGESVKLAKRQTIRDFSTRRHHPGRHKVELQINGERLAEGEFVLGD